MILALDISTVKIGIAILSDDGGDLILSEVLEFNSDLTLNQKITKFKEYVCILQKKFGMEINQIIVEEALLLVALGAGTAWTTAILNRFNGACVYVLYEIFNMESILINPNRARSLVGLKFKKGLEKKQRKNMVIEFVKQKFGRGFETPTTKFGNFKSSVSDRADAIVLALYGAKKDAQTV